MHCWPEEGSTLELGTWRERCVRLADLWRRNWRIGWPERARGLHYWLGFEYAAMLRVARADTDERWLDVGTGAWSSLPYLLADATGARVVAVDIDAGMHHQLGRRRRAAAAGLRHAADVRLVRGDGRTLPFADASTASRRCPRSSMSRVATATVGRCARSGGYFDPAGRPSSASPSGLRAVRSSSTPTSSSTNGTTRFERFTRPCLSRPGSSCTGSRSTASGCPSTPLPERSLRPRNVSTVSWDTIVTMTLLRPMEDQAQASAMLVDLRKPQR